MSELESEIRLTTPLIMELDARLTGRMVATATPSDIKSTGSGSTGGPTIKPESLHGGDNDINAAHSVGVGEQLANLHISGSSESSRTMPVCNRLFD